MKVTKVSPWLPLHSCFWESASKREANPKCYKLNCVSPKRYIGILTSSNSKCGLIWNKVFLGVNKVNEVISVGPNPIWLVFTKRAILNAEIDTHRKKTMWKDWEGGHMTGVMHLYKSKNAKDCQQTPGTGRGEKGFFPFHCQREHSPADILISDF